MSGPAISEPVAIEDRFVSGMAHVQDMGDGNVRLTYYVERICLYSGDMERVVVDRQVMSANTLVCLSRAAEMAMEATKQRKLAGFDVANISRDWTPTRN